MKSVLFAVFGLGGCTFSGEVTPDLECTKTCDSDQQDCYKTCETECVDAGGDGDSACDTDCKVTCDDTYDECTVTCTDA